MRYIIIPLVIILYLYQWYRIIKYFKKDWSNNNSNNNGRKDFLTFHIAALCLLTISSIVLLIIKYW